MEKIKLDYEKEYRVAEVCAMVAEKVNEMIDLINQPDDLEDRLKTLEDKIEFIMEEITKVRDWYNGPDDFGTEKISLQDLWDEQNEEHLEKELIKEFIEPTVKECNCYISDYTDIEDGEQCFICHRKIKKPSVKECDSKGNIVMNSNPLVDELLEKYNKDQKIEEIISYVNNLRWKHKIKELTIDDYYDLHNRDIDYLASWLRDKLRDICK